MVQETPAILLQLASRVLLNKAIITALNDPDERAEVLTVWYTGQINLREAGALQVCVHEL